MPSADSQKESGRVSGSQSGSRAALAIFISVLVLGYILGTLSGLIPTERRIDTVTLAIIAIAILVLAFLLNPEPFDRIINRVTSFEVPGVIKAQLNQVQSQVAHQEDQLDFISLVLPLLLPKKQQDHLLDLASDNPAMLKGNHTIRQELRQLRSMGLIRVSGNHQHIGEIKDELEVNPKEYVQLTHQGELWVDKIKELREREAEE